MLVLAACATPSSRLVSVLDVPPRTPQPDALEVVTVSASAHEPLPVRGSEVGFSGLAAALRETASQATAHGAGTRFSSWRLSLELIDASADFHEGRLGVRLAVRATLRTRADNTYLGQAQQVCSASGLAEPSAGAAVVVDCLNQLASDLDSWLAHLHASPSPR